MVIHDGAANMITGTEYMEAIVVYTIWTVAVFFLPETYAPVLLRYKARQIRQDTGDQRYWHPAEEEKINLNNIITKHLSRPVR